MSENKINVLKRKTTMIRIERHHNCRKKHLSVAAVVQILNSYHKMLERAQSKQNLIAQWGPPVKVSKDLEQKDGTLFVKDMRRELGLLQRILSVNMGNVLKKSTEVGRADNNENTENEYKESCYQTRSSRNKDNKTYDGSLFDDSESSNDDDGDADYQVKSKKKSFKGWLGRKFTHGKDEVLTKKANDDGLSKRENKQFIKIDDDEEEVTNRLEVNTPEFGANAEENEPQDTTIEKENREKSAASKFTNYLKSFKISMIKRKHKRDNESEATMAECPGKPEEANTEKGEDEGLPAAPTRKKRKREQKLVSCPMCDGMFVESEINDHAFTCNGEPPEAARSTVPRDPLLEQSLDYIPLQPEERPDSGNSRKPIENSDGFSEWKNACKRVVVSETGRHVESFEINHEKLFESIAQESEQIEKDDIQAFETKKKPRRQMKLQKPASHNDVQYESRADRMKQRNVDSNWMSDDSEDSGDKSELLNQYLGVKKTDKSRNGGRGPRGAKRRRAKPRLDEEDSLDESENCEKCFLCSTIVVKAKYPSHVMKCIAAAERGENVARKADNATGHSQEPQNDEMNGGKNRLKRQLGNRTSWAQYDKVDRGESNQQDFVDIEEDNEKHENEDDSPIKSFKPVGETSLFNFDNQFKNNMPKRRVKLSRNVALKNGNR
ncbi:uncharacterized protein LOC135696504 isoform X2 [Rhopilema esculentum]|uniref:uncharacterized protein LOC135696504 isoform X2 n=1 Tax=Rhopilema esculentum TaxID=499914 RepID=UPI0031E29375